MSIQPTTLKETERTTEQQILAPDPSATFTTDPSTKARLAWGQFLALQLEGDYEEKVFSTPGVVEALDEAIAEIQAVEDSP